MAAMGDSVLSVSAAIHPNVHSPEDVFRLYRGRRAGIVQALTEDVEEFYEQCDPDENALCLFGQPNGTWEVKLPIEDVPVELPEPVCGINFARDGTPKKVWLSMIAIHSDAWLMSMAFYHAGRVAFDRDDRELLFRMINTLPTVYEAVKESYEKQTQTLKASSKKKSSSQTLEEEEGANASGGSEDQAMTECAACQETYSADDGHFWIGCDHCERWFHGRCVGMTPEKADEIERYMCPGCSYKSKQNKMKAPRQVCGDDS
ncbi:PHD finger protein ALFIN-LIKE 4-like [Lolium rigidum]|uniref:PHD finger protein ALFIN-LIKE 4-like n=1 Tax=Lolium rigidum TaxID=89674 RepID=UPI001F5D6686|nr:PHD finger protein ALFIN-LIKE 4-like [Lolium rigidum]